MKEMIYPDLFKYTGNIHRFSSDFKQILDEGGYNGLYYYIINNGTHPTAYIEVKQRFGIYDYNYKRLNDISVHGGFSYYGRSFWNYEDDKIYLGWDYAHTTLGDYVAFWPNYQKQKEWTTEEILNEVHSVIDQINSLFDKK